MKTINKFLILLMLAVPFVGFTACSDDDDKDKDKDNASAIAGTYNGPLKTAEGVTYLDDATIKIERTGENVATLSTTMTVDLSQYGMGSQTLPIECKNSTVGKNSDGKYTIAGTTTVIAIINVAVSGTIDDAGNATINIAVTATTPPLNFVFVFSGTKQK